MPDAPKKETKTNDNYTADENVDNSWVEQDRENEEAKRKDAEKGEGPQAHIGE